MRKLRQFVTFLFVFCCLALPMYAAAQGGGGTISGTTYEDMNGNGVMDFGEMGMPEMIVGLIPKAGGETLRAVSDDMGHYAFYGVLPGQYDVQPQFDSPALLSLADHQTKYEVTVANGTNITGLDAGYAKLCVELKDIKILCKTDGTGAYTISFSFVNNSTFPIKYLFFHPPAGVTISPNPYVFGTAIPVGGTGSVTVTISGAQPNTKLCFPLSFHSFDLAVCCEINPCFEFGPCDCFQVLDSSIVCNPDGTFTYNFTYQNLTTWPVNNILFAPASPSTMVITPQFFSFLPIGYGGTYSNSVVLSGPGITGGSTVCFYVAFYAGGHHCCTQTICVKLPICPMGCTPCPGECWAGKPHYQDQHYAAFTGTVAAVTSWTYLGGDYVLQMMNLDNYQCTVPPLGTNWNPTPFAFRNEFASNPQDIWNLNNLGTIFGITIDRQGNIYVTQTSSWLTHLLPAATYWNPTPVNGTVYKIDAVTAKPSVFCVLPNRGPELGNISFDGDHGNQFFVTNMEDGKIYRISNTGTILGSFDPMSPDASGPGTFPPLGEALWGVQYHCGRVYYSVWVEDQQNIDAVRNNEIRSVAIDGTGNFVPASDQYECEVPSYAVLGPLGPNFTCPISDISFSPEGKMMTASRAMGNYTALGAHSAVATEFTCDAATGTWSADHAAAATPTFVVGNNVNPGYNCAGGVDYDYSSLCPGTGTGRRVWFTAEVMGPFNAYGLQGIHKNGGTVPTSIVMDLGRGKRTVGDVEIPCPEGGPSFPNQFRIEQGQLLSGLTACLCAADGECLKIFSDPQTLTAQVIFEARQQVGMPSAILFKECGYVTRTGLEQDIELFNFSTNEWDMLDSSEALLTNTQREISLTSTASQYVGMGGELRARLTWYPVNDEVPSQDGWIHAVDCVEWNVSP